MMADMKVKANLILLFAWSLVFAAGSDWSWQDSQRSESRVGVRTAAQASTASQNISNIGLQLLLHIHLHTPQSVWSQQVKQESQLYNYTFLSTQITPPTYWKYWTELKPKLKLKWNVDVLRYWYWSEVIDIYDWLVEDTCTCMLYIVLKISKI